MKKYEELELKVVKFSKEDIITTSPNGTSWPYVDEYGNPVDEDGNPIT